MIDHKLYFLMIDHKLEVSDVVVWEDCSNPVALRNENAEKVNFSRSRLLRETVRYLKDDRALAQIHPTY